MVSAPASEQPLPPSAPGDYPPIDDYGVIGDPPGRPPWSRAAAPSSGCVCRTFPVRPFLRPCWIGAGAAIPPAPSTSETRTERRYETGTNVLETRLQCPQGEVRLIDCMPITVRVDHRIAWSLNGRLAAHRGRPLRRRGDAGAVPAAARFRQGASAPAAPRPRCLDLRLQGRTAAAVRRCPAGARPGRQHPGGAFPAACRRAPCLLPLPMWSATSP